MKKENRQTNRVLSIVMVVVVAAPGICLALYGLYTLVQELLK